MALRGRQHQCSAAQLVADINISPVFQQHLYDLRRMQIKATIAQKDRPGSIKIFPQRDLSPVCVHVWWH